MQHETTDARIARYLATLADPVKRTRYSRLELDAMRRWIQGTLRAKVGA